MSGSLDLFVKVLLLKTLINQHRNSLIISLWLYKCNDKWYLLVIYIISVIYFFHISIKDIKSVTIILRKASLAK